VHGTGAYDVFGAEGLYGTAGMPGATVIKGLWDVYVVFDGFNTDDPYVFVTGRNTDKEVIGPDANKYSLARLGGFEGVKTRKCLKINARIS